jgi:hypothetical protein
MGGKNWVKRSKTNERMIANEEKKDALGMHWGFYSQREKIPNYLNYPGR